MAEILSPNKAARDQRAASAPPTFDSQWTPADGASFAPNNVPLKRVPRAWERKPQLPFARNNGVRKVWRRVQMPIAPVANQKGADDLNQSCSANLHAPQAGGTILSPRKVVKKIRLHTEHGQDSRITDWERERSRHMRKKVVQAPLSTATGILWPTSDQATIDEAHLVAALEAARDELQQDEPQDAPSDIASHQDLVVPEEKSVEVYEVVSIAPDTIEEVASTVNANLESDAEPRKPVDSPIDATSPAEASESARKDTSETTPKETRSMRSRASLSPVKAMQPRQRKSISPRKKKSQFSKTASTAPATELDMQVTLGAQEQAQPSLLGAIEPDFVSPNASAVLQEDKLAETEEEAETSRVNLKVPQSPTVNIAPAALSIVSDANTADAVAYKGEFCFSPSLLFHPASSSFTSPIKCSTSAPPEGTTSSESRSRPRVSDDTAVLQAFLNRAAAKKETTSTAKRESLSNRRDSDAVRHALASPSKVDVLAELDPNSPSPRKDLSAFASIRMGQAASVAENSEVDATTNGEEGDASKAAKPTRRSGRSRSRPTTLLQQTSMSTPGLGPNKITIRGPAEQVPLKRSEIQELAVVTRSNTRKNKGQSIIPMYRIAKMTAEEMMLATSSGQAGQEEVRLTSIKIKSVQWDETLAYYSEAPNEDYLLELPSSGSTISPPEEIPEEPPLSPSKARSRRNKSPRGEANDVEQPAAALPVQADEQDTAPSPPAQKSKVQPTRKRSRIATPAKRLLTSASLLPAEVAAAVQESEAVTSSALQKPKGSSARTTLPTPRKLNLLAGSSAPQPQDGKENRLSTIASTPKKSSIPSAPALGTKTLTSSVPLSAPKFGVATFSASVNSGPTADTATTSSRSDAGTLPNLASPAKKRKGASTIFAKSVNGGMVGASGKGGQGGEAPVPGLASPAKKRVRKLEFA